MTVVSMYAFGLIACIPRYPDHAMQVFVDCGAQQQAAGRRLTSTQGFRDRRLFQSRDQGPRTTKDRGRTKSQDLRTKDAVRPAARSARWWTGRCTDLRLLV